MKQIYIIPIISVSILMSGGNAKAEEKIPTIGNLMMLSKVVGMCGVLIQMARFQDTTKMVGGEKFVVRFAQTESARLGVSVATLMSRCNEYTKSYDMWKEVFREIEPILPE